MAVITCIEDLGVTRALEIIRNELDLAMAFCGKTRLADVDRSILLAPKRTYAHEHWA